MDEQKIKQKNFEYAVGKGVSIALLALAALVGIAVLFVLLICMFAGIVSGNLFMICLGLFTFLLGYATYRIFSTRQNY